MEKQPSPLPKSPNRVVRILVGIVLILPAVCACAASLLLPSVQTILLSLNKSDLIHPAIFVGMQNYAALFQDALFLKAVNFTFFLILERVLVVLIVPLLLALLLNEVSKWLRITLRLVYSIPLALFAPVATYLGWRMVLTTQGGIFPGNTWLTKPATAIWTLLSCDAILTFGIACAVGLVVYRVAQAGAGNSKPSIGRMVKLLVVPWVVLLLGTIASALQTITPSYVVTNGGPVNLTLSLGFYGFQQSFFFLRMGTGAVVGVLQLLILSLLGILAGVLIPASGLRIEPVPAGKSLAVFPAARRVLVIILLAVVCLLSLGPALLVLLPLLKAGIPLSLPQPAEITSLISAIPYTLFPVFIAVVMIQFPLAYLGGLGIGGLRPLGKYSEWLLLLFAPWLFVTVGPLANVFYQRFHDLEMLGTFPTLISPLWLSVPMLFALALFFKGRAPRWQAAVEGGKSAFGSFFSQLILPSLPFSALVIGIGLAVGMQDLLYPMIVATRPEIFPIPLIMIRSFNLSLAKTFEMQGAVVFLPWLIQSLLALIPLALFQIFYIDRIGIGKAEGK